MTCFSEIEVRKARIAEQDFSCNEQSGKFRNRRGKRMNSEIQDDEIIQLFWEREEEGLVKMQSKYQKYCSAIARRIVKNTEDTEECVNDTWLRVWNSIPPHRPENLSGYLAKVVRNLALSLYTKQHRQKRGGGVVSVALDELSECLSDGREISEKLEGQILTEAITAYLRGKNREHQAVFIRRYFYMMDIKELAEGLHMKENTVKSILFRMRKELKIHLEGEGIYL